MSKWFRVATEGATTDGRNISRTWIEQMAKNFDPKKYGARIWLEHIRGLLPDSSFAALGDVTALKTKAEDGKLGLYAKINPTDELKAINEKRQKIYTSMEVDTDFAGTGEAYLVGLAVTDTPASLGTSMLEFSQKSGDSSPIAARKQRPENLFTAAVETRFDFTEETETEDVEKHSLLDAVKSLFKSHSENANKQHGAFRKDLEDTLIELANRNCALETQLRDLPGIDEFNELRKAHKELLARFNSLHTQLDNTPDTPERGHTAGGDTEQLTDC